MAFSGPATYAPTILMGRGDKEETVCRKEAGVATQLDDAPGDSAIHVINHALLAHTKIVGTYDRKAIRVFFFFFFFRAVVRQYD